jgi:threonine/homoserine/homoserine lactone efflux protein
MRLVPFLGVVLLITITPGPDTALVVRHAVRAGPPHALATAAGCAVGLLVWGAAAAGGVTALITASRIAGIVLRVAGALYLVVLGVGLIRHAGRTADLQLPGLRPRLAPFVQGLLNNLLNPKAAAFFTALLPQFLPSDGPTFMATLLMAAIAAAASLAGLTAYGVLAHRARDMFSSRRLAASLDRVTGTVLIGLGARVAFSSRQ